MKEKLLVTLGCLVVIALCCIGMWWCGDQMTHANQMMRVALNDSIIGPLLAAFSMLLMIALAAIAAPFLFILKMIWLEPNSYFR